MQLGFARAVRSLRILVSVASIAGATPASADQFEAFCWARHHPASTDHVTPLIEVDPWVDLGSVADRLKQLPAGKRFIIFSWVTEDLADHPMDRCIARSWEQRPPRRSSQAVAGSGITMASSGRAPAGTVATANSKATTATGKAVPVASAERIAVDRRTAFRGPWMDSGIAAVRARVTSIMSRLKQLGAVVDGVAVDNETTLHAACFLGREGALAAIEADPRWPSLARSLGLPQRVSTMTWGSDLYLLWTERMAGRFDAAMQRAVMEPIRASFPAAVVSNYCTGRVLAAHVSPDINGHLDRRSTSGFGTHDNSEFYAWLADGRIARAGGAVPVDASWVAFRAEVHKIRGLNASSARPKHAWIASRSWAGVSWGWVPLAGSAMWDELVLQLGMHGVKQFFELSIEDFGISREENLAIRERDRNALEAVLAELESHLPDASPVVLAARQPSWNDQVIATGRRAGEHVVWRFSFTPGIDAVKVRLSDGSAPIVQVEEGRRGAWLVLPAGVSLEMVADGRMPAFELLSPQEAGSSGELSGSGDLQASQDGSYVAR